MNYPERQRLLETLLIQITAALSTIDHCRVAFPAEDTLELATCKKHLNIARIAALVVREETPADVN